MTITTETCRRSYFTSLVNAEVLKIFASRMPWFIYAGAFAAVYLWVFDFYHLEHLGVERHPKNFFDVFPLLFFKLWVSLLFHVVVVAFAGFWVSLDNQYGMIRVACTQPLTRYEYLLGKYVAISLHVVLIALVFLFAQCFWLIVYSGVRGVTLAELRLIGLVAADVLVFTLALTWIAISAASFRRTTGSAIITACLVFIGLAFLMTLPHDAIPPQYVFMRYLVFPVGNLPNPFAAYGGDTPFRQMYTHRQFLSVVLATPLLFIVPAFLYFQRRDITE